MTVSSSQRKSPAYAGNSSVDTFAFEFRTLNPDDVAVVVADSRGTETTLGDDTYTVTLNEDQDSQPGGSVVLEAPLASGYTLVIVSNVPYDQPLDITNAGGFYPDVLENQLDRTTFQIQQLREQLGRALKLPVSSGVDPAIAVGEFLAGYGSFLSTYYGGLPADPALDPGGHAVELGDAYYNTATGRIRIYGADGWFDFNVASIIFDLAANGGASMVGTGSGDTVQQCLDQVDADISQEAVNRQLDVDAEGAARIAADALKADDSAVVHKSGVESIAGEKTFTDIPKAAGSPTDPLHLVNLAYANLLAIGFNQHADVRSSTTAALPANTYNNGSSGVGATLTASSNGILPAQGGIALTTGQRLWVRHEAASESNGVYVLTTAGDVATPYVLTRAVDFDTSSDLGNASSYVQEGLFAGYTFGVPLATGAITVGTTAINAVTVQAGNAAVVATLALILQQQVVEGYAFNFLDSLSQAAGGIQNDGTLKFSRAELTTLVAETINGASAESLLAAAGAFEDSAPDGFSFSVLDALGQAGVGVLDDGTLKAHRAEVVDMATETINGISVAALVNGAGYEGNYRAEIVHLASYGQSLGEGSQATPPISTAQEYDSMMFVAGVRTQDGSSDRSSLVPLVESQTSSRGETPMSGMCAMVKQLIRDENGMSYEQQSYQMLASTPAEGGKNILELSKPSSYYTRFLDDVAGGVARASALSKSYSFLGYGMTQGEADIGGETPLASYKSRREAFHAVINADVKAITGQANDLQEYFGQTASHRYYFITGGKASAEYPGIALTQVQLGIDNPRMHVACAMYPFTYVDEVHINAASQRWYGAYLGLCHKRVEIDGGAWSPLRPLSSLRQGSIALLKFHVPRLPLVFDTAQVAMNTNYGFELVDPGGSPIDISAVSVVNPDTVKILSASPIPAGAKLRYAFTGSGETGPVDGARGNLRDSQGDDIVFDPDGINKRMDNWCVIFEHTLT